MRQPILYIFNSKFRFIAQFDLPLRRGTHCAEAAEKVPVSKSLPPSSTNSKLFVTKIKGIFAKLGVQF